MKQFIIYILQILSILSYSSFLFSQQDSISLTDSQRNIIPPNQRVGEDFYVLHYDKIPQIDRLNWKLKVHGAVKNKLNFNWDSFSRLDTVQSVSDFHCVTTWSRLDNHWVGVRIRDVLQMADPKSSAKYITFKGADGYTTSLAIDDCTGDDDLLAFRWEGRDLGNNLGGPVRAVIPSKYGYKSCMWLVEMKLTKKQKLGYWEKRGYSNTADPWKEERRAKKKQGESND